MKTKSFLFGLFVGGISAGIATLLSTPRNGKELRSKIKHNSESLLNEMKTAKEAIHQVTDSVLFATKEGQKVLVPFLEDLKTTIESWKRDIEPNQEMIKAEMESIEDALHKMETEINPQ